MPSPTTEPMSEAERNDMLLLIERRRKELLDKRQLLDGLAKKDSQKMGPISASGGIESSNLLKDVMAAMSEAQTAAAQKPVVAPTDLEPGKVISADGKTTAVDSGARYSHALKKVVGPLSAMSGTVDVIITPKVVDRFDKSVQCDEVQRAETAQATSPTEASRAAGAKVTAEEIKKKPVSYIADVAVPSQKHSAVEKLSEPQAPLSESEKSKLIYSSGFATFFQKASRMVERALGESELFDVFADYSQLRGADQGAAERLRCLETYVDDRWSLNRAALQIRTHPKFNELFLVSYAQKSDSSLLDPDGCALVWNMSMPQRAEYVFSCQSQVCTAQFDTYRPNHIIGGTFTGSIVLWDMRAKTRPVQRTPLSSKSHHHPIYSMQLVGTEHAHNLVTVDLDGRLCTWSLSMLVHPTETLELKKAGKDICCMCLDFADGENNSFLGGAEDGSLFQAQIHGSKAGIVEAHSGHTAPVSSVHWHPNEGKSEDGFDYCDMLLSSSLDWSVKLWSPKTHKSPLHSFLSSDDYCMDVEWHPQNPGVFASAHADGDLNIWDISKDLEVPYTGQSGGNSALTRLKWSNDGCRLTTGAADGVVKMWGVSNEISQARQEDRSRLAAAVEELKATAPVQRPE